MHATVSSPPLRMVFARAFVYAFFIALLYYSLSYWRVFQSTRWNIPGFAMLAAAMPWSAWWFSYMNEFGHEYGWAARNAMSVVVIPAGFAVNCAAMVTIAVWLFRKVRPPKALTPSETNAS